ncbi:crotonase/enoyl-CoA hydratase family protein [Geodermatophilus sabuli]|uniref:enoyl-CoA hydratase n=1 Tax=Geodermatophilus sabuli TaxID=1564158 RepID=A0A285E6Y3_9ACTN|nr:crotonase/enoyl-CoA hydratase family protein [Geodermatophilus sabuli]MBB3082507.1 crotonobetainyl-CoA hydratase [Geodermatophilus sabuli]SNX94623.1 short chain enoyl-CoA hydratase [Geodermatophilus sabuli]
MTTGEGTDLHTQAVLTQQRGNVLLITINRPRARNCVNRVVAEAIGEALETAETDPTVRVIVLTGAGDRAFCAGADLKALANGEDVNPEGPRAHWGFAGYVNHPVSKPTIAAVNGFALGGGTELALASDLVVAADTAEFGLPEVRRGLVAAGGGAFRLAQQIPRKVALEMVFTGAAISASRALALGLVSRVVPQCQVLSAALELAEVIAANAPLAVQATKRIAGGITDGAVERDHADWALNWAEAGHVRRSQDYQEGVRAFAEKRTPNWTGR